MLFIDNNLLCRVLSDTDHEVMTGDDEDDYELRHRRPYYFFTGGQQNLFNFIKRNKNN